MNREPHETASVADPSAEIQAPPGACCRALHVTARGIGHDINNCLGIVGGRAELVMLYLEQGREEGARKGLEVILDQVERIKELTDGLRDLAPRPPSAGPLDEV